MTNEDRVAGGYDAVYAGIPNSPALRRIWREFALDPDYPDGFEHISFLTLAEMRRMATALALTEDSVLVDFGCGMAGPSLWIARETGAHLVGIDVSTVALDLARARAFDRGLADTARFASGTFDQCGLADASASGVISVDALQYAPDKRAACVEAARILRPGGRFVFACFELDAARVAGLPVLGVDRVGDYRPVLEEAGFDISSYEESPGWRERVTATYQAIVDAKPLLSQEMGEAAASALLGEVTLTLRIEPYRRRVFVSARKR